MVLLDPVKLAHMCHLKCFDVIIQLCGFFGFSIMIYLMVEFNYFLDSKDLIFYPLYIANTIQATHQINCFMRAFFGCKDASVAQKRLIQVNLTFELCLILLFFGIELCCSRVLQNESGIMSRSNRYGIFLPLIVGFLIVGFKRTDSTLPPIS
jgi:hypothetical protein